MALVPVTPLGLSALEQAARKGLTLLRALARYGRDRMRMLLYAGAAIIAAATLGVPASAAAARNYDCSKAGNANKVACKGAARPTSPAAPAAAPRPTPSVARRPMTYDCSKAGNKNKSACRGAAPAMAPAAPPPRVDTRPTTTVAAPVRLPPAPRRVAPAPAAVPRAPAAPSGRVVAWTTKTGKVVHYDCSKAGNLNKKACQ